MALNSKNASSAFKMSRRALVLSVPLVSTYPAYKARSATLFQSPPTTKPLLDVPMRRLRFNQDSVVEECEGVAPGPLSAQQSNPNVQGTNLPLRSWSPSICLRDQAYQQARLRLPKGTVGRDYVLIQLRLGRSGPFNFMVDSGLTAELITPHLQQVLGMSANASGRKLQGGLAAGGSVDGKELVTLRDAALIGGGADVPLPPLQAVVTDFIQEHLDPNLPVEGMLGMEALQLFDADFDFPAGRLRLWPPNAGIAAAAAAGLVEVPAAVLNETGVLGIRATSPNARQPQPFAGVIDCGASFSAINWAGAKLAGLPPKGDAAYSRTQLIYLVGIDGRPAPYPLFPVDFTFAGYPQSGGGRQLSFEPPPRQWRPWAPVQAAVGDLPVLSQLLGDGRKPYAGPAALIGLDVLSQRRVMIGAGVAHTGRERQLYVSAR